MAGILPAVPLGALGDVDWLRAGVALGLSLLLAFAVHRYLAVRARSFAELVSRGQLSPEVDTRLRFLRRFAVAGIVLIGITVAFGLDQIAGSLLTSGAIGAAVIGFAARQTLANVVAGIMLAITQPLRVGDWVTFEEHYGVVEDVRLSYTLLRTGSDQRVLIPNERLAAGVLMNDTLGSHQVGLDVSVWIPPGADVAQALLALADETGGKAGVAEVTPAGIRISVGGDPVVPAEKAASEAALRARSLARLRREGLLAGFSAEQPNG
jgi:small-conductance mechanosensitive channel